MGDTLVTSTTLVGVQRSGDTYGLTPQGALSLSTPDLLYDGLESTDFSAPSSGGGVNTIGLYYADDVAVTVVNPTNTTWNGTTDNDAYIGDELVPDDPLGVADIVYSLTFLSPSVISTYTSLLGDTLQDVVAGLATEVTADANNATGNEKTGYLLVVEATQGDRYTLDTYSATLTSQRLERNWDTKTNQHMLRFRYAAGVNQSELRFDTTSPQTDFWLGYWIRVPTNYVRGTAGGQTNNKWMDIFWGNIASWPTDYSNSNLPRIEMQDLYDGSDGMRMNMQLRQQGANGTINSTNTPGKFVVEADAGRWMHVIYQLGSSSVLDAADAELKFWRRWEDEDEYTLYCSITTGIVQETSGEGTNGWSGGYLMGFANNPYVLDTEWVIDDHSRWTSDPTNGDLP